MPVYRYLHISSEFEYIDQCIVTFWGLMDFKRRCIKIFNSKYVVNIEDEGSFFTKFTAPAHDGACDQGVLHLF